MSAFLGQIGSLLAAPPGNLIYQLVLSFSVAGALQAAYLRWRAERSDMQGRAALGLGIMLAAILAYFSIGVAAASLPAATPILPPLDRAITFLLLTMAIWIWVFPKPSRSPDLGALALGCVAVAAGALEVLLNAAPIPVTAYNLTISNTLWQAGTIGLLLLGGALLYIRQTPGFANGLAFLALAFLGHGIHLVARDAGDYSGIIRLAHIAAFPLLLTLSQRSAAPGLEDSTTIEPRAARAPEPKRFAADAKTVHALIAMATESDTSKADQAMARAVSRTMLADLCFVLFMTDDENRLEVTAGYDLIREEYLQGTQLDSSRIPRLASAIQRGRPLRLAASGSSEDIKSLGGLLGLKESGDLLCAPLVTAENVTLGALLLLSPFSHRRWDTDDQNLLVSIAGALASLVQRRGQPITPSAGEEPAAEALRIRDEEIGRLRDRADELAKQLGAIALESEKDAVALSELGALRAAGAEAGARIHELERELARTRASVQPADTILEQQLKATLQDLARLQNQVALANQKILDLEASAGGDQRNGEQAEVLASIAQELRQPMSSIVGYTDLLLGESVGILGALQRKFIERIKASTERIGGLINDMIQLTTLEVGLSDLKPEAMDLNLIIDNALAYTSSQIREKKIAIHLDLPRTVAAVNADREALQQILIHLLQNAGAATPMEGKIALKVQTTVDEGKPYVMIQIADSGGGIPEEDLPRVFTRLFRADNVLIQGVGDTGVGLSIAKTLTEAQHGRIWVESQPGAGATFYVLLPAVADSVSRIPGQEMR